jgi:hypothetical protein
MEQTTVSGRFERLHAALTRHRESIALWVMLALGLVPRLAMAAKFPTIPVSDFQFLTAFAEYLHAHGLFGHSDIFWQFMNPGVPLVLCGLMHVFPYLDPGVLSRTATVFVCGFLPLLPYLIWRGVLPLWVRCVAGAVLALWPGQIIFSTVVAQDNWVLLPTVALAALAVRAMVDAGKAKPVAAGLVYAAAVAVRQEMLVVLLPLLVAAVRSDGSGWRWRRSLVAAGLAAVIPILALAAWRDAITGRFSVTTGHAGTSVLGAYVPGAAANGWVDPLPYLAATRPDLTRDVGAARAQASRLAAAEALRRPGFHTARILGSAMDLAVKGEAANLFWCLSGGGVLPASIQGLGSAFAARIEWWLRAELTVIQGLFLAALLIGFWRRNLAILALSLTALLKYSFHAVTVIQGRYLLAATALELIAIVVAVGVVASLPWEQARRLLTRALAAGVVLIVALPWAGPSVNAFVVRIDKDEAQHTYQFVLRPTADREAQLSCMVQRGSLTTLDEWIATVRTLRQDPGPGDAAVAACELSGTGAPKALALRVLDDYSSGGLAGHMIQRVEVDGAEVFRHDIAQEPGTGWASIPLGEVGPATKRRVVIEVRALTSDPGSAWGEAARTSFQIVRP